METGSERPWESSAPPAALTAALGRSLDPLLLFLRGDLALRRRTPFDRVLRFLGWVLPFFDPVALRPEDLEHSFWDGLDGTVQRKKTAASGGFVVFLALVGLVLLWVVYLCLLFPWLWIPSAGIPVLLLAHHAHAKRAEAGKRRAWKAVSLEAWNGAWIAAARRLASELKTGGEGGEPGLFLRRRAKEVVWAGFRGEVADLGNERHRYAGSAVLAWDGSEARVVCVKALPAVDAGGSGAPGGEEILRDLADELADALALPRRSADLELPLALPSCAAPEDAAARDPGALAVREKYRAGGFPELPPCPAFLAGEKVLAVGPDGFWAAGTVSGSEGRNFRVDLPGAGLLQLDASRLRRLPPRAPAWRRAVKPAVGIAAVLALLAAMVVTFAMPVKPKPAVDPAGIPLAPWPSALKALPELGRIVWARDRHDDRYCLAASVEAVEPPDGVEVRFLGSGARQRCRLRDRDLFEDSLLPGARVSGSVAVKGSPEWFPGIVAARASTKLQLFFDDGDEAWLPLSSVRVACSK